MDRGGRRQNRICGIHRPGRLPAERRTPLFGEARYRKLNAHVSNILHYHACITHHWRRPNNRIPVASAAEGRCDGGSLNQRQHPR